MKIIHFVFGLISCLFMAMILIRDTHGPFGFERKDDGLTIILFFLILAVLFSLVFFAMFGLRSCRGKLSVVAAIVWIATLAGVLGGFYHTQYAASLSRRHP